MASDNISSWVAKAKEGVVPPPVAASSVKVIKREQTRGNIIMDIAEKIYPWFLKMFDGVRDENGMVMQPAHVRGIALNVAQSIIKEQEAA